MITHRNTFSHRDNFVVGQTVHLVVILNEITRRESTEIRDSAPAASTLGGWNNIIRTYRGPAVVTRIHNGKITIRDIGEVA